MFEPIIVRKPALQHRDRFRHQRGGVEPVGRHHHINITAVEMCGLVKQGPVQSEPYGFLRLYEKLLHSQNEASDLLDESWDLKQLPAFGPRRSVFRGKHLT